jgi:four helix bundle protein
MPDSEREGLISQMRRAAVSISANIAEGAAKASRREFVRYLDIAIGSAAELESHLLLARALCFIPAADSFEAQREVEEIRRMITALIDRLKKASGRAASPGFKTPRVQRSTTESNRAHSDAHSVTVDSPTRCLLDDSPATSGTEPARE